MTVYKWSSMSPRERDALVAEKVMGLRMFEGEFQVEHPRYVVPGAKSPHHIRFVKSYTTDISAAWEVVERMKTLSCSQQEVFHDETNYTLFNITPEAICRAALKAVGVDIQ